MQTVSEWVDTRDKNVDYADEYDAAEDYEAKEFELIRRFESQFEWEWEDDVGGVVIYYVGERPVAFYDYENAVGYRE
jgi:hypothetical protein